MNSCDKKRSKNCVLKWAWFSNIPNISFLPTPLKKTWRSVQKYEARQGRNRQKSEKAMSVVGLDYATFAQRSPFDLSGGEKRRAAIAGVIAMQPKILILDEPVAGLDPVGREEILALVKSCNAKCLPPS